MTHWGAPDTDDEYPNTDSEGYTDIAAQDSDSDFTDTEPLDSDTEFIIINDYDDEEEEADTPVQEEVLPSKEGTLRRTDTLLSRVEPQKVSTGGVEVSGYSLQHRCEYNPYPHTSKWPVPGEYRLHQSGNESGNKKH